MEQSSPSITGSIDLNNLFLTMELGVVYHDREGKIIAANPAAEVILGIPVPKLLGMGCHDPAWRTMHEDGSGFTDNQHPVLMALKTGKPVKQVVMGVFNPLRNDHCWVMVNAVPLFSNNEPVPHQVISTFNDITHRKKAELELNKREQIFHEYFEMDIAANYFSTPEGKLIDCNQAFVKMLGYASKEELLEIPMNDIYPAPVDRISFLRNLSEKKVLTNSDCDLVRKDGKKIHCLENVLGFFDNKGRLLKFRGYMMDITKRQEAERAVRERERFLNAILHSTVEGFWILEANGRLIDVNEAFCRMTGYDRKNLIGKHISDLDTYEKPEDTTARIRRIIASGSEIFETHLLRNDGHVVNVEVSTTYLDENGGKFICFCRDLTQRNQSDEKIALMAQMLDDAPASITIHDFKGNFLYANRATINMHGYADESEFRSINLHQLDGPESEAMLAERFKQIEETGEARFEVLHKHKNGHAFPLEVLAKTVVFNGTRGVISIASDITERKRNEETIRKNESLFRFMVKNISDVIVVIDKDGKQKYVSSAIQKMSGFSTGEVMGKYISDVIHPDDLPHVMEVWNAGVAHPDQVFSVEYRHIHKTKGWVQMEAVGQSFLNEPDANAVIVSVREITERKRTELYHLVQYNIAHAVVTSKTLEELVSAVKKELSRIFDRVHLGIAFLDEGNNVFRHSIWKDEQEVIVEETVNHSFPGIVIKKGEPLFLSKADLERLVQEGTIDPLVPTAEFYAGIPLIIHHKAIGALIIQSYREQCDLGKYSREVLNIVANQIGLFIEKLRDNQALVIAKEKAEESDRLKSAFLANMSHEIRTPMNAILGFTDLFPDAEGEEKRRFAGIVRKSSKQLLALIDDVLFLSRLQSESIPLNNIGFKPAALIDDVYQMFDLPVIKKRIELKVRVNEPEKDRVILADHEKIKQVLSILVSNALKYTLEGSVEIGYLMDGGEVEFFVTDTGIGIPEHEQQFVFENFYRGEQALSLAIGGTGLGLKIARGLVGLLGGELGLSSRKGVGSRFSFTIPAEQCAILVPEQNERRFSFKNWKQFSILIAEDEPDNYLYLEILLHGKVNRVDHANNGKEAVEMALKNDYNLILMDIKMPLMNGIEATRFIKLKKPLVPVIAQTAYAQTEEKERVLEAGCDDYIAKPIEKGRLMEMIDKYMP